MLFSHPKILEAAVVAKPDEKWETSQAVSLKPGEEMTTKDVIDYCKERWRNSKSLKQLFFSSSKKLLLKTQKFRLREIAKNLKDFELLNLKIPISCRGKRCQMIWSPDEINAIFGSSVTSGLQVSA